MFKVLLTVLLWCGIVLGDGWNQDQANAQHTNSVDHLLSSTPTTFNVPFCMCSCSLSSWTKNWSGLKVEWSGSVIQPSVALGATTFVTTVCDWTKLHDKSFCVLKFVLLCVVVTYTKWRRFVDDFVRARIQCARETDLVKLHSRQVIGSSELCKVFVIELFLIREGWCGVHKGGHCGCVVLSHRQLWLLLCVGIGRCDHWQHKLERNVSS